jgi:hypothetical protein
VSLWIAVAASLSACAQLNASNATPTTPLQTTAHPSPTAPTSSTATEAPIAAQPVEGSPAPAPLDPLATPVAPGQCWVQAVVYPLPRKEPLPVTLQEGATTFEVTPAQLAKTEKMVTIREGGTTYRIEPPVYKAVKEKVLVKPEIRRTITIPPVYETRTETVVIEAERTVLEKCRIPGVNRMLEGAVQPLCARTIPAKTQQVKRRVLVQPATTKEEVIPAEYKEVTRWVVERPARAVPVEIEPTVKKIPALEVAQPETVKERSIPPKVVELVRTLYEGEPKVALRQAICDSDLTPELVKTLQEKLKAAGYDPGPVDGKLGVATSRALIAYQRSHGLAAGAVTFETLEHFRIPLPSGGR